MMYRIRKTIEPLCMALALAVSLAMGLNYYVLSRAEIDGFSMTPALQDGEQIWIDRISYRFAEPERYDVVVFRYRYRKNEIYMKRIIGLPGETVQISDGYVFIDGDRLEESYGTEPIEKSRRAKKPIVLGADEYFVLGDNRNYSTDSRDSDVANVPIEDIKGKVMKWQNH